MRAKLRLSLVVVFYNMAREAPRTLFTMSTKYQRKVHSEDYEVIVVDAGSEPAITSDFINRFGSNFRLLRFEAAPSPVAAVNRAVEMTRGDAIALCIDGARMLSPGIVRLMLDAFAVWNDPVVATLAWHLGPRNQSVSMLDGYNQEREDELLASVDWQADGYELFRIAALAGSSEAGWFHPIAESNCLAVRRESWRKLGGLHEGFLSSGGGLVNLDFYRQACDQLETLVILLGEGSFHQFHGGVTTNTPLKPGRLKQFFDEYTTVRGRTFERSNRSAFYFGSMPAQAMPFIQPSAVSG